jgi:DNA-binding transcriptional LysR family regulator
MDLLHYMKTFVCLAEKRTMAKAMDSLLYSQPTISTHIAYLEKRYGCSLLEYKNKQYSLTEEGACLYKFGVKLLNLETETSEVMAKFKNLECGTLSIGASSNIGVYSLPPILSVFHKYYHDMQLNVSLDRNYIIEQSVLDCKLAIGIIETDVSDTNLTVEPFKKEPLALIVPPDHPWASRKSVRATELLSQPFVVGEPGSGTRRVLERQLGDIANQMKVAFQMGSTEAVKKAVENSLGISVVGISAIERELQLETLIVVPIENVELYKEYKIIYRSNKYLSEGAKRFIAVIRSFFSMEP